MTFLVFIAVVSFPITRETLEGMGCEKEELVSWVSGLERVQRSHCVCFPVVAQGLLVRLRYHYHERGLKNTDL